MIERIHIELSSMWSPVRDDKNRHHIYTGHRWTFNNVTLDEAKRLELLLKGVGSIHANYEAYPALIKIYPYATRDTNVSRIVDILAKVFGESC